MMVSVIIPTFNRSATIEKSIESVLSQTYNDIEVIVIDDGSTDNTSELLQSIGDNRVRYYWQENAGACAARNKGISLAKGELIAFHDSDDIWLSNKLARQIEVLEKTGADICFCQMRRCNEGDGTNVIPKLINSGFVAYQDLVVGISTQTLIMKREVAENTRFDEKMPRFQDLEWLLRAVKVYSLYGMREVLVEYFFSKDSISMSDEKMLDGIRRIAHKYPKIRKEAPKVQQVLKKFMMDKGLAMRQSGDMQYEKYMLVGFSLSGKIKDKLKYCAIKLRLYHLLHTIRCYWDKCRN